MHFLHFAVNCVDRHAEADPGRVALLWERDEPGQQVEITYEQLADKVIALVCSCLHGDIFNMRAHASTGGTLG